MGFRDYYCIYNISNIYSIKKYLEIFRNNLFNKNIKAEEDVFFLFEILKTAMEDPREIIKFIHIINSHKLKCQEDEPVLV